MDTGILTSISIPSMDTDMTRGMDITKNRDTLDMVIMGLLDMD